jgi:hypothetical protein
MPLSGRFPLAAKVLDIEGTNVSSAISGAFCAEGEIGRCRDGRITDRGLVPGEAIGELFELPELTNTSEYIPLSLPILLNKEVFFLPVTYPTAMI